MKTKAKTWLLSCCILEGFAIWSIFHSSRTFLAKPVSLYFSSMNYSARFFANVDQSKFIFVDRPLSVEAVLR